MSPDKMIFHRIISMRMPQVPLYHLKTWSFSAPASCCRFSLCKGMWNFTSGPCFKLTWLQKCSWLATLLSQIRDSLKTRVDYRPDEIKKKKKSGNNYIYLAGFAITEKKHERHLCLAQTITWPFWMGQAELWVPSSDVAEVSPRC